MTFCIGYVNIWNMSKEQPTLQKDDLTALIDEIYPKRTTGITDLLDAVFPKSDGYDDTRVIAEARTDKERSISATPEENNKNLPAKIAVGALAVAMAIGGIVGLGKLTERTASAKITIYDPKNAQEQICSTQATLEESLGLAKSNSYDTFRGCEGTANMLTETEEGLKSRDKVRVIVTTNAFGEAAVAEKVKDQNS